MKNIIKNITKRFNQNQSRPNTVEEIVKGFSQTLAQLQELSVVKQREVESLASQIGELEQDQVVARNEQNRADTVASKLQNLLF